MKTSISRIHNDNAKDALPFSPLVWTSKGFVILTDERFNLKKIQLALYKVCSEFTENDRQIGDLDLEVKELQNLVTGITDNQTQLILVASELQNRIFPILQTLSGLGTSLSITNAKVQKDLVTINDIASVADTIRKGQLLTAVGKDVEITVEDSSYKISTKLTNGLLESGDNVVEVVYDRLRNSYEISAGVVRDANIETGLGLSLSVASDKKSATLRLDQDFLALDSNYPGLNLTRDNLSSVFYLKPNPNLVSVAPDSGLVLTKTIGGLFEIDLAPSVMSAVQRKYEAGYGINILGKTISVNTDVFPKFVSGSPSVAINKLSVNPDIFEINFDPTLIEWPDSLYKKITVNAALPLTLNYEPTNDAYKIGLDTSSTLWKGVSKFEKSENASSLASNALDLVHYRTIKKEQLAQSFLQTFGNPLYRMFCLHIGDYANSGILGTEKTRLSLAHRFGTKPTLLEINADVVPYISGTTSFADGILGSVLEFDLFAALQDKLRSELNDPTFSILEHEKNSIYTLVEANTNSIGVTNFSEYKKKAVILTYNSAFLLDGIEDFSSSQYISNIIGFVGDCSSLDRLTNYHSTSNKNQKLSVTGGDVDYILGNPVQGQKNDVALILPTSLVETDKIKLKKVVTTVDTDGETVFTMTIYDGYTAATYVSKFSKKPAQKIVVDKDYISEISGNQNPGQVRAFARLYTNSQQSDLDINRIIYFLGRSQKCYAKFVSLFVNEGALKQKIYPKDISDFQKNPKYSLGANIDYEKGIAKIAAIPVTDYYDLINDGTLNTLGKIKIRAQFRISGLETQFLSPQDFMKISCWDIDTDTSINCAGSTILPFYGDPENNL